MSGRELIKINSIIRNLSKNAQKQLKDYHFNAIMDIEGSIIKKR